MGFLVRVSKAETKVSNLWGLQGENPSPSSLFLLVEFNSLWLEDWGANFLQAVSRDSWRKSKNSACHTESQKWGARSGRAVPLASEKVGRCANEHVHLAAGAVYRWLCICQSECLICKKWEGRLEFQIFKGSRTVSKQLPKAIGEILTGKKKKKKCCRTVLLPAGGRCASEKNPLQGRAVLAWRFADSRGERGLGLKVLPRN